MPWKDAAIYCTPGTFILLKNYDFISPPEERNIVEHVFLPTWLLKRLVWQVRYGVFLLWKVDQRIKGMFGRISLCFFPGMQVAQCAERPWDENSNPKLTVATMKSPWCHLAHTSVCPAKPFQNATWTKIWNLAWLWSRTVRVQQGTLRSSACSGGVGGNTLILGGGEHCDLALAVEVRRRRRRWTRRRRSWQPSPDRWRKKWDTQIGIDWQRQGN